VNRVYVVRCPDYDQVEEKVAELLAMMGGMDQFVAEQEKIVLKVNLLLAAEPEKAVTTHPAMAAAVGKLAKAAGAAPIIADSPGGGFPYTERGLDRLYRTSGMHATAEKADIAVNLDTTYQAVSFPKGKLVKRFEVIAPVLQADGVLNLCKLKTHSYMSMTGAVKNSFGVIPGLSKPGYHAKLHDPEHFADMLLDLSEYVAPRLSIMDAVIGMEGDGPNAGTPRPIGLLLAAMNPLALDVVAGEIIGLDRENNPILLAAERRGLGPNRIEEVEVIGLDVADLRIPGYKLPATVSSNGGLNNVAWWQRALMPLFKTGLTLQPRIIDDACIACGACRDICPMHIVTIERNNGSRYARIEPEGCIRCYCCHEKCPEDAIELHSSLLYRVINR